MQLLMIREQLTDLPALQPPSGYRARHLRSGEGGEWDRIIAASFGGDYRFDRDMEANAAYKPEKVWFICDDNDRPIATASAWYQPQWPATTGYLHMVGIMPEHEGRKLGYWVSLAALRHMAQEGRTRAVLHTDDHRVPAIKTYLNLGFIPQLTGPDLLECWRSIASQLGLSFPAVDSDGNRVQIG